MGDVTLSTDGGDGSYVSPPDYDPSTDDSSGTNGTLNPYAPVLDPSNLGGGSSTLNPNPSDLGGGGLSNGGGATLPTIPGNPLSFPSLPTVPGLPATVGGVSTTFVIIVGLGAYLLARKK